MNGDNTTHYLHVIRQKLINARLLLFSIYSMVITNNNSKNVCIENYHEQ